MWMGVQVGGLRTKGWDLFEVGNEVLISDIHAIMRALLPLIRTAMYQ